MVIFKTALLLASLVSGLALNLPPFANPLQLTNSTDVPSRIMEQMFPTGNLTELTRQLDADNRGVQIQCVDSGVLGRDLNVASCRDAVNHLSRAASPEKWGSRGGVGVTRTLPTRTISSKCPGVNFVHA